MAKTIVLDYTFDASAKTITFDSYAGIEQENILLITNVTDGVFIYSFADPAKGGTVATNVLTLEYDTTSMDDTDVLQIIYDDPLYVGIVTGDVTISGTVTVASHAVTNAGTFVVQDSQVIADNGGFTDGTSKVFPAGFIYDEVAGTALTENDVAAARINVNRALVNALEDGATRGRYATVTASNALKVDASGAAVPITDNSGSLTIDAPVGTPAFVRLSDGAAAITTLPVSLASVPSHAVTNAGTFTVQDSEKLADNAGFTDGATKVNPVGYIYDEVAGTALTENDIAAARINVNRAQVQTIEDGSTRGRYATVTAANALKVDASGVAVPVTDNSGSLTVDAPVGTPVNVQIGNATLSAGVVDETGTSAVDALATGGGTPHDSVDSGNPVKVGFKAVNALPTAVANLDRANGVCDLFGRQMTTHIDPAQQIWKEVEATSAQTGTAIWTPAGGKKIAITHISITTGGTTAGVVTVWFGASGDTTYTQGTDQVVWRGEFAPSTTSKPFAAPPITYPIFAATADYVLRYTTSAGITVYITVYGYEF